MEDYVTALLTRQLAALERLLLTGRDRTENTDSARETAAESARETDMLRNTEVSPAPTQEPAALRSAAPAGEAPPGTASAPQTVSPEETDRETAALRQTGARIAAAPGTAQPPAALLYAAPETADARAVSRAVERDARRYYQPYPLFWKHRGGKPGGRPSLPRRKGGAFP